MKKKHVSFTKNYFEHHAWATKNYVCGIDEAGRGCLAGPLVAAAAVLPHNTTHPLLKDSKALSPQERQTAYQWITKHCFYSYAIATPRTIDTCNIYQATRYAMKKAFVQLLEIFPFPQASITHLVTDVVPLTIKHPYTHKKLSFHNPTHAETLSVSVAAASIVAKVTRDMLLEKLSSHFPTFSLEQHKGYGTKVHTKTLFQQGASIIHRTSFLSFLTKLNDTHEHQQTIC